ncbi:hypothetical protein EFM32_09915, partial [Lactiplantibacillus plantarum]|nr:hypothetical protein [Lactiplantibacillus plantarum]
LLKDGFVVNTILKEADLFCPNSVRINFTIYRIPVIPAYFFLLLSTRSPKIPTNTPTTTRI